MKFLISPISYDRAKNGPLCVWGSLLVNIPNMILEPIYFAAISLELAPRPAAPTVESAGQAANGSPKLQRKNEGDGPKAVGPAFERRNAGDLRAGKFVRSAYIE